MAEKRDRIAPAREACRDRRVVVARLVAARREEQKRKAAGGRGGRGTLRAVCGDDAVGVGEDERLLVRPGPALQGVEDRGALGHPGSPDGRRRGGLEEVYVAPTPRPRPANRGDRQRGREGTQGTKK